MVKRQSKYQAAVVALALLPTLAIMSPAVAVPPPGGMPPPPGFSGHDFDAQRERDQAALHLSPSQTTIFKGFVDHSRATRKTLIDQIKKIHSDLSDAYGAYRLNERRVTALNDRLNQVQLQLLALRLSEERQLRKILTPTQFAILKAQMRKHEQDFRGGWGHPGGPPPHGD